MARGLGCGQVAFRGARGALRIPVDGGCDLQAEVVLPRERTKGPDALASSACRSLIGEVAESTAQLEVADQRLEIALARERQLDAFVRALVHCPDAPSLHSLIIQTMARAVGADIGAIALPMAGESQLGVTATYGYPSVVVEHVRQAPGEGILGRVFSTGQAVVVRDVAEQPDHARRRRYRSSSYLAFPLTGPVGVQAVIAVTDKADGEPFNDRDLAILMSFGAPASLALGREELRERTRDLAHQATIDGLTGLFNRRYFETRLEQEIQRQRRQFDELSLLMVDLDNFKDLNDYAGASGGRPRAARSGRHPAARGTHLRRLRPVRRRGVRHPHARRQCPDGASDCGTHPAAGRAALRERSAFGVARVADGQRRRLQRPAVDDEGDPDRAGGFGPVPGERRREERGLRVSLTRVEASPINRLNLIGLYH